MAAQDSAQNDTQTQMNDPFASQRGPGEDTFEQDKLGEIAGPNDMGLSSSPPDDRRMSREWDASKVPPSQFQKRKGSIYSTPNSRDGHVKGSSRDQAYHDKIKEKGWGDKVKDKLTGGKK